MSVKAPVVNLPDLPDQPLVTGIKTDDSLLRGYLQNLKTRLGIEFGARTSDIQVRRALLLKSPGDKIFSITVSDTGVISATQVGVT